MGDTMSLSNSDWKEYKLEDIILFQRGHDLPKTEMLAGKYPVAGSNGVIGYHNNFTTKGPGVTIGRSGNIGNPQYYESDYWAHNTVLYVKEFRNATPEFIYYFLLTLDFTQFNAGSAVPTLNRNHIHDLRMRFPEIPEQQSIASILSSLDDKIDLLHRQNKTLEQLAETLFRQWFVLRQAQHPGADESWEEKTINDVCLKINSGGTPSTKISEYYNGSINWYSTKELNDNFLFESVSKITETGLENSSAKLFPENTIVIAIYAAPTVGRLGILANEASFNQAACGFITDEDKICFEYLYLYLLSSRQKLNDMASGSAQQNLNVTIMKDFPIIQPTLEIMIGFRNLVRPIFRKIKENSNQIRTLTQLRDTLLPKLMSGEVRVK
ncbi:MAG: restriction endonuclease subunit S [Ignavibacteriales bacterium]|nr:restriction endonuclease subunit S [Ignavibacteriales bacterium]